MSITLGGPIGLRNRVTPVRSLTSDQIKVIDLLMAIDAEDGGMSDIVGAPPLTPGSDGNCPPALADAIWNFQGRWLAEGLTQDGVVDPNGRSLAKLNALAAMNGPIILRQVNDPALAAAHTVTNPVISPVAQGNLFTEFPLPTTIHDFLFEVRKGGSQFWVGAAVPLGTVDFTRAQVFFHPTVVQGNTVHAADADYPAFKGGWSGSIQRYTALEGGQLAGARLMPLLVPFTTMGALVDPALNMFNSRPVKTLNAIMRAIQDEVMPGALAAPTLTSVGVSSFSSGIKAMRLFISAMSSFGLVKEVTDFDSPFIIAEPKTLTRSPGAVSRCYTQFVLPDPEPGWVNLPPASFANIASFGSVHAQIGWMMYFSAMLTSTIV